MSRSAFTTGNTTASYTVTLDDLPLSCPLPGMALWDAHPKVFLPIEKTGEAVCPYCSARYFLLREKSAQHGQ